VAHRGVVERREAEAVAGAEVLELHVELAVGDQLAADHVGVHAIAPAHRDADVGAVALAPGVGRGLRVILSFSDPKVARWTSNAASMAGSTWGGVNHHGL